MDTTELSKLADILRKNGADVFSGSSKFALSLNLLCSLNDSFSLIVDQRDVMNSSFHVINSSNERIETFRDMHFLHDFIQRSGSLKLTPPNSNNQCGDISQFKNLKLLEIHNLNVDHVQGIEAVRSKLQQLICTRSLKNLANVLEKCGGDNCEAAVKWDELKEGVFSHNNLESIHSLLLMPNLHTLDLSHNNIEDAQGLNELINLKNLNLSYNKLVKLPEFTGTLCNRIQILVLCYNFIEDLTPLSDLTNLRELDLAENCIVEHKALVPIANVATLQMFNLTGNPLSFHPQHRSRTARYLHDNTATVCFLLDKKVLSKAEKHLVGSLHPRMRIRTTSSTSTSQVPAEKPRRIRNVTITDNEYTPIIDVDRSEASVSSLVTSTNEHLDAKLQIESLKKQYGNEWLNKQSGFLVQDVLGIEKSSVLSSTPYGSSLEYNFTLDEPPETKREALAEAAPSHGEQTHYVTASETMPSVDSNVNLSKTNENESSSPNEQEADADDTTNGLYESAKDETRSATPSISEDEDLGDGEENIFLAKIKNQEDPVFIVITQKHILERECTSTKEKARWPIETLTTCESDESSITIYFDTIKNDAKSRTYEWDDEESPKLLNALRTIIENQPAPESKLNIYKCLKCSTQFGVELTKTVYDEQVNKCPTCGSDLVFEDDL